MSIPSARARQARRAAARGETPKPEPKKQEETVEDASVDVADLSIPDVMAFVGTDKALAVEVLETETAGKARKGLISELEALIDG